MNSKKPRRPRFRDLEELRDQYLQFRDINPDDQAQRQRRGYFLEDALFALLYWEGLEPRSNYRPAGEEIDGAFYLAHHVYLVEAKWRQSPLSASDVYAFMGKISGKLQGTLGVFVSMSGYAEDAIPAVQKHKDANVLLFDQSDIEASIIHKHKFIEVLSFKIRQAGELGEIFVPFELPQEIADLQEKAESVVGIASRRPQDKEVHTGNPYPPNRQLRIQVFCEGESDVRVLSAVMRRLANESKIFKNADFRMLSMNGKHRLLQNLSAAVNVTGDVDGVLVVIDSDGGSPGRLKLEKSLVQRQLRPLLLSAVRISARILFAEPFIEQALGFTLAHKDQLFRHAEVLINGLELERFLHSDLIRGIVEFTENMASPSPWDEAGRIAVRSALSRARWDIEGGTVTVFDPASYGDRDVICRSSWDLRQILEATAELAAQDYLPYDGGSPVFEPDCSRVVEEELEWFSEELGRLRWTD